MSRLFDILFDGERVRPCPERREPAGPAGAVRLVLSRVAALVGLGVVAGTALSLWAAKYLAASSLIYGLQPRDPATLLTAALVLSAIGALAGYLPARRASRIDPARVLREG